MSDQMFVSREREKLINAIIYFVRKTKHCHTLKLFKLLNFLDFEHFRQTGRTITGLDYVAWDNGPAPNTLWHEMQEGGRSDFRDAINIFERRDENTDKLLLREIKPKKSFDKKYFSKRELQIMERLAEFFTELKASDMSEFSHDRKLPWRKIYMKGEGKGKKIPTELAFDSNPIVHDVPTIDNDEYEYRKALQTNIT